MPQADGHRVTGHLPIQCLAEVSLGSEAGTTWNVGSGQVEAQSHGKF